MGFFDRLFSSSGSKEEQPDIRFGRYSDSYKTSATHSAWNTSLEKFDEQEYLESYRNFFLYLRDDKEDNVRFWEENGGLAFELFQGSKKITGFANAKKLKAEAKIAKAESLNVGFMRRLIEQNFELMYSRFALDAAGNLTIVFDTYTLDGSPYKLYYALREVAIKADKQDDLLLDEFQMLQPVDTSHLKPLPQSEKEAKYNFIQKEIKRVLDEIENGNLDKNKYPKGINTLILHLIYKLDYLIKPEGYMMEALERIHRLNLTSDGKSTILKNQLLIKELQKLVERPRDEFFKEMYSVTSTFGITSPVNHDRVVGVIDGELHNMDWYHEHNHHAVAMAVPGYIVGFCLFNYAIPKPDRELLHLYFQVIEAGYFKSLGFTCDYYDAEAGKFNKRAIKKAIEHIIDENKPKYPKLHPATASIDYTSPATFAKSFLVMVRNLDMMTPSY